MHRKGLSIIVLALLLLSVIYSTIRHYTSPELIKASLLRFTREKIGRELAIAGDIDIAFLPEGVMNAKQITLSNNAPVDAPPLLTLDQSRLSIDPRRLLAKELKINQLSLSGLTLRFITHQDGSTNWNDLLTLTPQDGAAVLDKVSNNRPASFTFSRADEAVIEQATIIWQDQRDDTHIELSNVSLHVNNVALDQPMTIKLSAQIGGKTLINPGAITWQAIAKLDKDRQQLRLTENRLQFFGFLPLTPPTKLTLMIQAPQIDVDITRHLLTIPAITLTQDKVKLDAHTVKLENVTDKPALQATLNLNEFNPVATAKQWGVTLPARQNPNSFNKLALQCQMTATSDTLSLSALHVKLDNTQIKGRLSITVQSKTKVTFDLAADQLKLDDYVSTSHDTTPWLTNRGTLIIPHPPGKLIPTWQANGQLLIKHLLFNAMQASDVRLEIASSERTKP